uniref:Cystatin domain-containing protein n=1 Tax=Strongyloides venezuelensis TaxID=75913 RepID=A0A0K0FZJ9_STRVS
MTIDGKKRNTPRTTSPPGPPKWRPWGGRHPLNARHIAIEATKLFLQCGYHNFKFLYVYEKQKRYIAPAMRYRVKYFAQKCNKSIVIKTCIKKGKNKKGCHKETQIKLVDCYDAAIPFQAVFKDDVCNDRLRLNVTNLENGNSCALIIRYDYHN